MTFARSLGVAGLLLLGPLAANAQKKALTQADWDRWRSIQGATLSGDGRWAAYTLSPQVGDGEFVVRATSGTTEYRVPVGYIGRPNNTPGGARGAAAGGGGGGGRGGAGGGGGAGGPFSYNSKFAFVTKQATKAEVDAAAAARPAGRGGNGGAANTTNQTSLVIINLATGEQSTIANVRGYRLPAASGSWMIYSPGATADSAAASGGGAAGAGGRGGRGGAVGTAPHARFGDRPAESRHGC